MKILPRLLHIMQTVSIRLPPAFSSAYRTACTEFICGKSRPRLNFDKLTIPKLKGGIGLPDLVKYQWPCQLTRIVDWNLQTQVKPWVQLEYAFCPLPLHQLPWIASCNIPLACKSHPFPLHIFKQACKKIKISPSSGPLTPIHHNPPQDQHIIGHWPCIW